MGIIENRGKATCGDIDILMSRADGKPFEGFLNRVVKGYLIHKKRWISQ